jgi:regulator of protease activity HflC (stomatin/prohibitin superfamily)
MAKLEGTFIGAAPTKEKKHLWWRFIGRHLPSLSFGLLVTWLAIVVLWPYMVITVPSGEVGVLWYRLLGFDPYCWCFAGRGTVLDPRELREEGLHVIAPWNKLFLYDLRLQSSILNIDAISKDGVNVTAEINVRYQLVHNSVGVLHKFIGPKYFDSVVAPEIGSEARQVISRYTAQEVYTSRQKIQDEIRQNAQQSLATHLNALVQPAAMEQPDPHHYTDFLQNSILLLDTLVLDIKLPRAIVAAINRQAEQFYMIQEWKYRVQREAEEAQRKQIEANGIAEFQRTVSQGISDSYLRWRGIEATLALAQSPNAKIVIIGSGKDGLPIILGNVEAPTPTAVAPKPSASVPASPGAATSPVAAEPRPSVTSLVTPAPKASGGAPTAAEPANSAANAGSNSPSTLNSIGASSWQSVLSRIYRAVGPTGSMPPSGAGARP